MDAQATATELDHNTTKRHGIYMMSNRTPEKPQRKCRVLVIGSSRPRLAKVMSLLLSIEKATLDSNCFDVEYLPCVALFDSYEDEKGNSVRYLISVNYHGAKGTEPVGSSLAPFFDQEPNDDGAPQQPYLGILGAAIGIGVEDASDVAKLETFFQTLRGNHRPPLALQALQPNFAYASMKEETEAFKKSSAADKEEASRNHTVGPGKMALFVRDFAAMLVQEVLAQEALAREALEQEHLAGEEGSKQQQKELEEQQKAAVAALQEMDESKIRYACRKCRTPLFGQDDLEEHAPAQHKFNARKLYHGGVNAASCESYFLSSHKLPAWAGDISDVEGRLSCPKCKTKVGTWHWAGAQCSCGTWVSPAVQIPKSKVDVLNPVTDTTGLPPNTVISPLIAAYPTQVQS
jgi:dual specificity phosphatase 12